MSSSSSLQHSGAIRMHGAHTDGFKVFWEVIQHDQYLIFYWPHGFLSLWSDHVGIAPPSHQLRLCLPSSYTVQYKMTAPRSTPTSSTCLFSAQTQYRWFLQSRVEGAVPTGSFTPPWGHCLFPLYIKKPQLYQHHQVGVGLSLIGMDSTTTKKRLIRNNLHF